LNYGESFENCAEREVLEETGLVITEPRWLAMTNDFMPDEGKHYVTVFMGADLITNGRDKKVSDEEQAPKVSTMSSVPL
jgi:8-oxo-dGTP diphosphatase